MTSVTSLGDGIEHLLSSDINCFYPSFYSVEELLEMDSLPSLGEGIQQSLSSMGITTSNVFSCTSTEGSLLGVERPRKIHKTISWDPQQNLTMSPRQDDVLNSKGLRTRPEIISMESRPAHANHDHVIAERKRREKLCQRFIELSAIIPGLKKADKDSILVEAIKHIKELEEKVKSLEIHNVRKVESMDDPFKKSQDGLSIHINNLVLPEIKARLSEKTVLFRIHCENLRGLMIMVLSEIEKLHLTITSASVMPFLGSFLDITVSSKIEEGFSMTASELEQELGSAFSMFMERS